MLGIDQLVICKVVEAPLMASDLADEEVQNGGGSEVRDQTTCQASQG